MNPHNTEQNLHTSWSLWYPQRWSSKNLYSHASELWLRLNIWI